MRIKSLILAALCMVTVGVYAQSNYPFNGLDMNMGNLSRLSDAKTRSISPENFTGEKGKGGMADPVRDKDQRNVANAHHAAKDLGKGWKVNPFIIVKPGETITIADIEGPGAIQQIWMTPTGNWRFSILRMYWDDEKEPSVECPVGDFFCSAYNEYAQLSSLAVCVNPGSAFNCYWKMPFRKKARITLENINTAEEMRLYYQINYTLENHLTSLCDTPKAYEGQPGFEVLRTVPGTWDEIRVPLARMNEHVTVARRSGSDWWVGSLNNGTERDLKLELDFLSEGDYQATIYTDAEDVERNPNNLDRQVRKVTRKDIIELNLAKDGGALLHIRRL